MRSLFSRAHTIAAYALVFIISVATKTYRLTTLTDSGTPIFDEKHYVPQAWQMVIGGGMEDNPGYGLVVHPGLGKWLMSLPMHITGYTPLGWRLSAVIAGSAITMMIVFIAHRATGLLWAGVAAGLYSCLEGVLFGMSRVGMLDIFLSFFVVAATLCIVMDCTTTRRLPYIRPWLAGAGILFGAGMSVKISGVFYPALAGIIFVAVALCTTAPTLKDRIVHTATTTAIGLVYFCIIPTCVWLVECSRWLASPVSPYRFRAESVYSLDNPPPQWLANILPDSLEGFYSYQKGVLSFHSGLTSSAGNVHPWESKPYQWLVGNRPMLFATINDGYKESQLWLLANPAIWWLFVVIAAGCLYVCTRKNSRFQLLAGIVAFGIGAGFVPWAIMNDRQMYLFYTTPLAPFVVLGAVVVVGHVGALAYQRGWTKRDISPHIAAVWGAVMLATCIFFAPWIYGLPVTHDVHNMLTLFDSWEPLPEPSTTPSGG